METDERGCREGCVTIRLNGAAMVDESSFHEVFQRVLGFPGFYGKNMNAWIDCLSYIDDPDAGMTTTHVPQGGTLLLHIDNANEFKREAPSIFESMIECAAFVNYRRVERGEGPVLGLSFHV